MNILKKIYIKLIRAKKTNIDIISAVLEKQKNEHHITRDDISGSVLIVTPHADDEWVGCSSLLRIKTIQPVILNMDMPGGDNFQLHQTRRAELCQSAKLNDAVIVNTFDKKKTKEEVVYELIKKNGICLIAIPSFIDWHPEHLECIAMLANTLRTMKKEELAKCQVLMYQVSVPLPNKIVTHAFKMTRKEQKEKWKFFRTVYQTQSFFPVERFMCNEYINGKLCDAFSAEVFSLHAASTWLDFYTRLKLSNESIDYINNNYTNIRTIRKYVNSLDLD